MKTIKFRVWDSVVNKMYYPSTDKQKTFCDFFIEQCGAIIDSENMDVGDTSYRRIALQFTGLLDKNGKEIYEGDVVKTKTGYCGNAKFPTSEDKVVVEWDGAVIKGLWSSDIYEMEIIGNIYENTELASLK